MRALSYITGRAGSVLLGCTLVTGCLNVRELSLGAFERDAGSLADEPSEMQTTSADAESERPPLAFDAGAFDAGARHDDDDERERERRDGGDSALDVGLLDAAVADASRGDAAWEAGGGDATLAGDGSSNGAASDAGLASDAGDAARSLLCTIEPWHCL